MERKKIKYRLQVYFSQDDKITFTGTADLYYDII